MKLLNQKGVTVTLCTVDKEVASSLNTAACFRFSVKHPFCLFSISVLEKSCWKIQQLTDVVTKTLFRRRANLFGEIFHLCHPL